MRHYCRPPTWRNEVCQDLLCCIADPHDAAWKHQSMSLTPVTTQNEAFIAVVRKCKTPQNMKGVQARHRHAASLRTCTFVGQRSNVNAWHAISSHIGSKSRLIDTMGGMKYAHVTYIGSLHVAPNQSGTECNQACPSTLDQQCVHPKQPRQLAPGSYILAC